MLYCVNLPYDLVVRIYCKMRVRKEIYRRRAESDSGTWSAWIEHATASRAVLIFGVCASVCASAYMDDLYAAHVVPLTDENGDMHVYAHACRENAERV